jgi:ribosomal protein L32
MKPKMALNKESNHLSKTKKEKKRKEKKRKLISWHGCKTTITSENDPI